MFEEREFEGKDLEQALHEAAAVLGIPEPELDYRIVEQGRRGLFGVGARSVRIRVMPPLGAMPDPLEAIEPRVAPEPAPVPERPPQRPARGRRAGGNSAERPQGSRRGRRGGTRKEIVGEDVDRQTSAAAVPAPPASEEVRTAVVRTLERMIELMGLSLEVRLLDAGSVVTIELGGADRQALLENDHDLLHALQFLLNRMSRRCWPDAGPIALSCDGERELARDDELVQQTREIAEEVRRTGRARRLAPMNAYERRLVHLTVREFERLGSRSEGNGHLKRVKIFKHGDA